MPVPGPTSGSPIHTRIRSATQAGLGTSQECLSSSALAAGHPLRPPVSPTPHGVRLLLGQLQHQDVSTLLGAGHHDLRNAINNQAFGGSDSLEVLSFDHGLETPNTARPPDQRRDRRAGLQVGARLRPTIPEGDGPRPVPHRAVPRHLHHGRCRRPGSPTCRLSCSMAGHCSRAPAHRAERLRGGAPSAYEAGCTRSAAHRRQLRRAAAIPSSSATGTVQTASARRSSLERRLFHDGRYVPITSYLPVVGAACRGSGGSARPGRRRPAVVDARARGATTSPAGPSTARPARPTTANFSFKVDGLPVTLTGFAYGGWRTDVCSTTGVNKGTNCPVGWSGTYTPSGLTTGTHTLQVTVTSANGQSVSTFKRNFTYQP